MCHLALLDQRLLDIDMKTLSNNLRLFWQGALLSYIALFHWICQDMIASCEAIGLRARPGPMADDRLSAAGGGSR